MRRIGRQVLIAYLIAFLFAGCGPSAPAARFRIAVIPKGTTHDFWKAIHAGAEKAAGERGGIRIFWEGPSQEDQRQEQQNIVERFTSEAVDAIILAPCDKQSLVAPVEAALKRGIPVVIIDSGLAETPAIKGSPKYLGYVATDNEMGGALAAERVGELLKGKKGTKVIMLPYQAGSESTELREAGFHKKMRDFPDLRFETAKEEAGATVASAQTAAERLLALHPDLDVLFAPNESSSTGSLQALRALKRAVSNGKDNPVRLVGFDGSSILIDALNSGDIDGLVLQDPFDMGYQAVLRAVDALEGRMPAQLVRHTNLGVATRENLEQPAIRALYAPDLSGLRK
jgi:ribose transport system substrate-binding protein